jgi:hypothetical protein
VIVAYSASIAVSGAIVDPVARPGEQRRGCFTADGWIHCDDGRRFPSPDALSWYADERDAASWIDLGGES